MAPRIDSLDRRRVLQGWGWARCSSPVPGAFAEELMPHAGADRGAVLSGPPAARHRQRPAAHQRRHHAGDRRRHAPGRAAILDACGRAGAQRRRRNLAGRRQRRLPPLAAARREKRRRQLPGLRPVPHRVRRASTTSARSSRSRIPAARRTFTSRSSRRAARACSRRSATSKASRGNERDGLYAASATRGSARR